ncbi:cell death activator CIDE-B [Corythoichthys intestinalis]|uniref:cell death activator CIDE-B n=1 Tax=Corythoichthys intestinalis TaxID=161448 RepID=UPI0025A59511|nr:cell death activator CIDE-B [Corythoichthys intestinalis]
MITTAGAKSRLQRKADIVIVSRTSNRSRMDSTSSLLKSVTKRVWSPSQRPFRVRSHNSEAKKGVTASTLEELKDRVCRALLLVSPVSLVCEEDGTEVDSDDFLATLPDNAAIVALRPGQTWRPSSNTSVALRQEKLKSKEGKDIASVTLDLYKMSPKDLFGSLSVKATFQGLYSVSADFQCLGPKKVLREALRVASALLNAAGHLLITSASVIRRVIEGVELWQSPQKGHL